MRKTTLTILLFSLVSYLASAQFRLVPLPSFSTNGDGTIRPGDFDYWFLTSDGNRYQRGLAFNPKTGHLLIADRISGSINTIDALTGAAVGALDPSSLTFGGAAGFYYDQVAVADDGAVYAGNLTTSGSLVEFILYRWASETDMQTRVFGPADPGNGAGGNNTRWGDTLIVRGSGINTEVLLATQSGNLAAVLKPSASDLSTFTNVPLSCAVPFGGVGYALAFGSPGTFFGKGAAATGKPTYVLGYSEETGAATNLYFYGLDQFPGSAGALAVQSANHWLAALEFTPGNAPDLLRLYDVSSPSNSPVFLDRQPVAAWTNANGIFAGAVAFGFGTNLYALNSDNGLAAYTVTAGTTPNLPPLIFGQPISHVVKISSNTTFSVGVDGALPLACQWFKDAKLMPGRTSAVLSLNNCQTTDAAQYFAVLTNLYGAATSSVASLTCIPTFGNLLDFDPFNYPPDTGLVGQGGWVLKSTAENGHIEAGNLDVQGLPPSTGNRYTYTGNNSVRWLFDPPQTNSAIWFSFAMRIDTIGTSTSSETLAGLAQGTTTSFPCKINIVGDGVGNTYRVGMYKGSGATDNGSLATNVFTSNDVVFVVGRYTFRPDSTNDDSGDLWLNPPPATFGDAVAPSPTLADQGKDVKADLTYADGFMWRWSSGYPKRTVDEFRLGYSWADVTPPAQPVLSVTLSNTTSVVLYWSTNTPPSFTLESIAGVNDQDGWQPVITPVVVRGANYTVTIQATARRLFRLKK